MQGGLPKSRPRTLSSFKIIRVIMAKSREVSVPFPIAGCTASIGTRVAGMGVWIRAESRQMARDRHNRFQCEGLSPVRAHV